MDEVRLRLQRSSTAPLHINTREAGQNFCLMLYDLFSDHNTRIASMRTWYGSRSFFERQDFPCMRLLEVAHWYPIRWGSMPKLQSLQLSDSQSGMVPLSELAPLKMLVLYGAKCTSILRHSQSLTTLMLNDVLFVDAISGPLTFHSLTYLSLFGVRGLKPHVKAPRLVTYHEGDIVGESFNTSLLSLVEYGVYHAAARSLDPAAWHLTFPNIQRLAIRAKELVILSMVTFLADQPHLLPALKTISAGNIQEISYDIAEGIQEEIESLALVRNEACDGNVVVCFETRAPFKIPIFFGVVSDLSIKWSCAFLTHILVTKPSLLKALRSQFLTCSHSSPKL